MNTADSTERDGDQCRAHLVHAFDGRVVRTEPRLDVTLDVFNHHNRIIDHDTDRKHQPEEREVVKREAEHRHEKESADQRYGNGHDWDDRGPPGLQEQDDDQNDEDNGFADRRFDRIDRLLNELVGL